MYITKSTSYYCEYYSYGFDLSVSVLPEYNMCEGAFVFVCVCVLGKFSHTSPWSPAVTVFMLANVTGALVLFLHAVSVLTPVSGRV